MLETNEFKLNFDAFANGQVESKLWLRDELLKVMDAVDFGKPPAVWILGGWYATTAFFLLSSAAERFSSIRSFDERDDATAIANRLNHNWEIQNWKFRAFTLDCNEMSYCGNSECEPPQIVINTSCEHFLKRDWWDRIPEGTLVVLQSNNMKHPGEDVDNVHSMIEFEYKFPLQRLYFQGEKSFRYENWRFTRFMQIGFKGP